MKNLLILTLSLCALNAQAQLKLNFDMGQRGPLVTDDHYGIFFEEINHAGDGGLYAELVRNRSFEEDMNSPICWTTTGNASMSLISDGMLNIVQKRALRVNITGASGGVRNEGYWGINIVNGRYYSLSFWMRAETTYQGTITVELQDANGNGCGRVRIPVEATTEWKKYTANIKGTKNVPRGYLSIKGSKKGVIVLDVVSLFPPTFKDRPNGCREDLAQMLADMRPGFMRFPGGCYIEGMYTDQTNRFEWKKTVGPIEERPGHMNQVWGYRVTDGLGYHEMLQLAEDIGAASMFVVNMGIGHDWKVDENNIDPFIQEALDAIEYAMGGTDTFYGKMRADNGHPEPFVLRYLEIGNEQDVMLNRDDYMKRYMQFYRAIKTRWPDIHLIANSYNFDNITEPVEILDEHHYSTPEFFISQYDRYDNRSESGTKVYVGEYAVRHDCGWWGNLTAAIAEAVFMEGTENNSSTATMLSYAPLFVHEENTAWLPDIIRFNCSMSYGTPSYYVQRMFGNNIGKQNIKWTETINIPDDFTNHGTIGVGTWNTSATFTDLSVTASDTTFIVTNLNPADWTTKNGAWTLSGNTFRQTSVSDADVTCVLNHLFTNTNVDFTLKATKDGGGEGFLIIFDYKDASNYAWLNLGGWGNTKHGVEQCKNGGKGLVAETAGTLETGREYTIRVLKEGQHVRCYLDGELILETNLKEYASRQIYTCANIDDDEGILYVKLVNPTNTAIPVALSFTNGRVTSASAEVLTSPNATDENTVSSPYKVIPKTQEVAVNPEDDTIDFNAAAYSVNVLRLNVTDVNVPVADPLPTPRLRYSFDDGIPIDDTGTYPGTLYGNASIEQMEDGNYVLSTGLKGENSYMGIPVEAIQHALGDVDDFTVSLNVLQRIDNNTSKYSWALSLDNGTSNYFGLINAGGNSNWYCEFRNNGVTNTVDSWSCLQIGEWHNLTYTQKNGTGRLYVDGQLRKTQNATVALSAVITDITHAYIGRSPYTADATMEHALFDDLQFFDCALSELQIRDIAARATAMKDNARYEGIADFQELENLVKEVKNYYKDANYTPLTRAYNYAEVAVSGGSEALKRQRYEQLLSAVAEYQQQEWAKAAAGEEANLTFLIENSSFTRYNVGWQGADNTAIRTSSSDWASTYEGYGDETAEQFSRPFDIYQELENMPAGTYILTCNAFYRAGSIETAYDAWQNQDPTTQYAQIYINEASAPLLNLYSSDAYTYSPYKYPDNLTAASKAFNSKKLYGENNVSFYLESDGQPLRLGIRKLSTVASDWVAYDHFQLHYEGIATGIVTSTQNATQGIIYDLMGRRVKSPIRGVYIIDGRKVLIL